MTDTNHAYLNGLRIVHENDLHAWVLCPCGDHIGEGRGEGLPHGSTYHCCDMPHSEPPGITRFAKPGHLHRDNEV